MSHPQNTIYKEAQYEWEDELQARKDSGNATITEENELYDIRLKDNRCVDCGKYRIEKNNICHACLEEMRADNLLTR